MTKSDKKPKSPKKPKNAGGSSGSSSRSSGSSRSLTRSSYDDIEQQPIRIFTERAYLDYSMYVILDRALPHISDGLKPVQRRIIYAMSELGLKAQAKHKKSARTIGDVLGKFHPHGESACYEAMVLMAQPFSYRYPWVDGQGNFGSPDDPKSFAAMRYTESRLSKHAEILLSELEQGTVEWSPNFDGSLDEPKYLPARLPTVLLNGTTGIAVGMATDIPPHNLQEVAEACVHLIDNKDATLKDIVKIIKGPDYPTEAEIITPKSDIHKIYQTGNGTIRMRAVYEQENDDIIVTALPYMVSGSKILEQIADQIQNKKLPLVSDLRDESDHENPTRLIITPRSNRVDVEALMNHLFATTDLERTYRVNLNMIGLDGRPKVKNLVTLLKEWIEFRTETVRKRLQYRLEKVKTRLHILDGFLIAFLNIDEVIAIIRKSENPKEALIKKYKLSEEQADAILDLKLRQLAKLEEMKIKAEQKSLAEERDSLEKTLGSEQRLKTLIKSEIQKDAETFGDKRRSPIVARAEAAQLAELERVPVEPTTVILSSKGWVRAGKGHEIDPTTLSYKTGDSFKMMAQGKTNQPVVFIDSTGRSYALTPSTLPSARGYGEPLTSRLAPSEGATFEAALFGEPSDRLLLMSSAGYGFIVKFEELIAKNKNGKTIIRVPEGAALLPPLRIPEDETALLALGSSDGKLLVVPVKDIPEMNKGRGQKLLALGKGQQIQSVIILSKSQSLNLIGGRRNFPLDPKTIATFVGEIGSKGQKLPKGYEKYQSLTILE